MKSLLLLEWMKVRKYKAFWVFLGLFVVVLIGVNYVLYEVQFNIQNKTQGQLNIRLFDFPEIWSTTAWLAGFSVLLLGLLIIVLITNEYNFKTHRQHVIDGLSRMQFIAGKWLLVLALLLFAWLLYIIMTLIMGGANNAGDGKMFAGFHYAGYFLLKTALSLSVAFLFAIWFKRSGLAIALYLAYVLLLEGIISHLLNLYLDNVGDFLPLKAGSHLVSNPFSRLVQSSNEIYIQDSWLVLTCLAWIALFVWISLRYIRKADL